MIERVQFVNEMKKALDLPESHNVVTEKPSFRVTTDEFLDPKGFDLKCGKQTFHFNVRDNSKLAEQIVKVDVVPEKIKNEIIAVLLCEDNIYLKGFRDVMEKGAESSRYCRFHLAEDYFKGKDGYVDIEKAISLLRDTPWGGYDEKLKWIVNPLYRRKAAKMCIDKLTTIIQWEHEGDCHSITDYSKAKPFMNIIIECSSHIDAWGDRVFDIKEGFGDENEVNNYAVYLFENGHRHEAFFYFKYAADFGHKYASYMVGISYLCGLNLSDKYEMAENLKYRDDKNAKRFRTNAYNYLKKCGDLVGFSTDGVQYECLSYLCREMCIHDNYDPRIEEYNRKGAEKGYSISMFELGNRLIYKSIRSTNLSETEKKKLRDKGEELKKKAKSEVKMPYWCYKGGLWYTLYIAML